MTDRPTNAEVEAMIHAVIDSRNVVKTLFENEDIKIIGKCT